MRIEHQVEQRSREDVMSHRHPLWRDFVRALKSVVDAKEKRMEGTEVTEALLKLFPGINLEASLNWLREWAGDSDEDILFVAWSDEFCGRQTE